MAHELTVKARSLLNQQAGLDLEFLETLNAIVDQKVYAAEGFSSSHKYFVELLGLSEDSVWRRTKAAELLVRFPALVRPLVAERKIHLTGLAMLHPVLTADNAETVLSEASGKSKNDIRKIVLRLAPRDVPRTFMQTVSADVVRLHVNLDAEAQQLLGRIKDIAPDADDEVIMKAALAAYFEKLQKKRYRRAATNEVARAPAPRTAGHEGAREPTRKAATKQVADAPVRRTVGRGALSSAGRESQRQVLVSLANGRTARDAVGLAAVEVPDDGVFVGPKDNKRYVDAATARFVYARDNYCCTFVSESGHRCGSSRNPQLHHRENHAWGGEPTVANLTVHCATHNLYQGELDFGRWRPLAKSGGPDAVATLEPGSRPGRTGDPVPVSAIASSASRPRAYRSA